MNKKLLRQCISCRTKSVRDNLIRITKTYTLAGVKEAILNPNKYQLGRSAYICKTKNCINSAVKEKKIVKMLKIPAQLLERITPQLEISLNPHEGVKA
ncbi:MAG: YlxR family protein [Candidatus Melainabacteria bacterium]|nr:YlxR family protein [Candidatus Melainabacteria bacterium]